MINIEELWKDNRIYAAYREAKKRLKKHFSGQNLYYVLETLVDLGDVEKQRYYLDMWRKRGGDDRFITWELYVHASTLNVAALKETLFRVDNLIIRADILGSQLGQTDEALSLLERVKRDRLFVERYDNPEVWELVVATIESKLRLYRGEDINLKVFPEYGELGREVKESLEFIRRLLSGELEGICDRIERMVNGYLSRGSVANAMKVMRYRAFLDTSALTLEMLVNTFEKLGDRFSALLSKIFLSFVSDGDFVEAGDIPEEYGFLRAHYDLMRKYRFGEEYEVPEELKGLEDLWWYVSKRKYSRPYLSFAGKLRLYEGKREVKFRSKKVLVTLAYLRLLGREALEENLDLVFPNVKNPKRRLYQALSELGRYRYLPTDVRITLRRGNFLRDEHDPWALYLKEEIMQKFPPAGGGGKTP